MRKPNLSIALFLSGLSLSLSQAHASDLKPNIPEDLVETLSDYMRQHCPDIQYQKNDATYYLRHTTPAEYKDIAQEINFYTRDVLGNCYLALLEATTGEQLHPNAFQIMRKKESYPLKRAYSFFKKASSPHEEDTLIGIIHSTAKNTKIFDETMLSYHVLKSARGNDYTKIMIKIFVKYINQMDKNDSTQTILPNSKTCEEKIRETLKKQSLRSSQKSVTRSHIRVQSAKIPPLDVTSITPSQNSENSPQTPVNYSPILNGDSESPITLRRKVSGKRRKRTISNTNVSKPSAGNF